MSDGITYEELRGIEQKYSEVQHVSIREEKWWIVCRILPFTKANFALLLKPIVCKTMEEAEQKI